MKEYSTGIYPVPSYEDLIFGEAGSANDCTGLIPSAVRSSEEYESYGEICDYSAADIEMHRETQI